MLKKRDFLLIGAQEPMDARLRNNSNIFFGIPPYFTPYGKDFIKISTRAYNFPAYALPILGACIARNRYSVFCINDFYSEERKVVAEKVKTTKHAVGISTTFLTNARSIINIAEFIRKINPTLKIVTGGPGIVNFPEVRRYADINVFCEGEEAIKELAPLISKRIEVSKVRGISFIKKGKEYFTDKREYLRNLEDIPIPRWDLLIGKVKEEKYLPIESSRGCVGKCSFCLETRYWPGVRLYPVPRVIRELKNDISRFGVKHYYFQDSNISNNRAYLEKLCGTFRKEGLNISWSCESRVDTVTKDLVDKMFKAGCRAITFGLESADPTVLRNMNKRLSNEKLKNFVSIARFMRKRGMIANINIIAGFPGENSESLKSTVDFLLEARPIAYSISKFFLERGTEIWKKRKAFGLSGKMHTWKTPGMESKDLDNIVRGMFIQISKNSDICHWASASVDLIRHMSRGKSLGDFVKYMRSVNQICLEDLTRKGSAYTPDYDKSFRYIAGYLR